MILVRAVLPSFDFSNLLKSSQYNVAQARDRSSLELPGALAQLGPEAVLRMKGLTLFAAIKYIEIQ